MFGANAATCLYLLPDIFAEFQRPVSLVTSAFTEISATKFCSVVKTARSTWALLRCDESDLRVHHILGPFALYGSTRNPLAQRTKLTLEKSRRSR